jgi:hypothetical protein
MSLLDDWETGRAGTVDDIGRNLAATSLEDSQDEFPGSPTLGQDRGLCALEPVDRQLTRCQAFVNVSAYLSCQQSFLMCL